jgi:cytochrome subunit of sulfide dehydrogenase
MATTISTKEVNVMTNAHIGTAVLACTAMFLSLSTAASAADVDKLVEPCFACHGKNGNNTETDIPNIASYSEEYLTGSLKKYKDKIRPCVESAIRSGNKKGSKTDMCKIAAELSASDIAKIGEYFVEQTFVRTPQQFDAELAKKGKSVHNKNCYTCHSESGSVPSDHAGILAGQKIAYLRQQIKFFKEGKRPMSKKMQPKLEALDDGEIEAVINYFASIQ